MFGRATIRFGIGPHSSFLLFSYDNYWHFTMLQVNKRQNIFVALHFVTSTRLTDAELAACCVYCTLYSFFVDSYYCKCCFYFESLHLVTRYCCSNV